MMKLLRIELLKLLPYRAFKILFAVYFLLLAGILLIGRNINQGDSAELNSMFKIFQFPNIWNYYLYYACIFNIILGILVIFITTNEYAYKTIRQNSIDGLNRNEIVAAKILLIIVITILSTVIVYISGAIGGIIYSPAFQFSDIFIRNSLVFGYFIQCLGVLSMAYLFGTIFKRSGIATLLFIIFIFPLDVIINKAVFKGSMSNYLPVSTYFVKIINSPYTAIRSMGEDVQYALSYLSIIVGSIYILIFFVAAWLITRKRDL